MKTNGLAALVATFALVTATSCGKSKDLGEGLTLSLTPKKAVISPGDAQSCVDRHTDPTARSVSGPYLTFNSFRLTWDGADPLYVSSIRFKIEGAGISSGSYTTSVEAEEMGKILGNDAALVEPGKPVASDDPDTRPSGFRVCQLRIGGISLTSGEDTPSFHARVSMELIGTSVSAEGTERVVRKKVDAEANWYGPE